MNEAITKAGEWTESFEHIELRRQAQEIEALKRERVEFAAALITTLQFLGDVRRGFAKLSGQENRHHWENLDAAISVLQSQLADPSVCLKAHDAAKDAEIRQLKNILAYAARELLLYHKRYASTGEHTVYEIARFLGYKENQRVEEFLACLSIEEPVKA